MAPLVRAGSLLGGAESPERKLDRFTPVLPGDIAIGELASEMTIRELAEVILDLTGSRSRIVHRPLPADDPRKRRPDISEADRLIDWHPTTTLKEGLAKTIPYFEQLLKDGRIPTAPSNNGADATTAAVQA